MDLGLSGLASGFDWRSLVDQLIEVERAPEQRMRQDQNAIQQRSQSYGSIKTQLLVLQNRLKELSDPELFESRLSKSGDTSIATVDASAGTPAGSFKFAFTQLAAAARQNGIENIAAGLNSSNDVSTLQLNQASFSTAVTAGTLTVNGKQISITATETLKSVLDKIGTASGGAIEATYSAATDKINLTSSSQIVLGSSGDTSNFFQVAKLYNNGSGDLSSTSALGGVKLDGSMASANLRTGIVNGSSGAGQFKINGVAISYNAAEDSIQTVLDRINNSAAGVAAGYDSVNDRFTLTNQSTGDVGFGLENVSGNFLTATGLIGGELVRGKNLLYSINGGEQLVSRSNTITESTSRVPGLSVTALKEASVTVSVSSDTAKIKSAITAFVSDYNKVQSVIDSQTASSTDADGKVTAGTLTGDGDTSALASKLRTLANTSLSGLGTSLKTLESLGINSNGNDDTLSLDEEDKLDAALADNLDGVRSLFADQTFGLAVKLNSFVETMAGEEGSMIVKQDNLTKESARIDAQIMEYERRVATERQRLIDSFVSMETAQAKISQQLQYLTQRFGS